MDNKSESCGFCPDGFKTFLFHRIKDVEDRALIDNVITEIKDMQTKLQEKEAVSDPIGFMVLDGDEVVGKLYIKQ
tara:strand:+ start:813 stop:1037 length:225 start_codon:yes stop_codon:yes gene_type:complete